MSIFFKLYAPFVGTYLKPQRFKVTVLTLLLVSTVVLQLTNPQLLGSFIDSTQAGNGLNDLTRIALLFLGVVLAAQVLSALTTYMKVTLTEWRMYQNGTHRQLVRQP